MPPHMARVGPHPHRLVHSPRDGRPGERENLAMAWHGHAYARSSPALVAQSMIEPARSARLPGHARQHDLFPATSRTGNLAGYRPLHADGVADDDPGRLRDFAADWDYLICRYSPPGNKDGKPMFVTAAYAQGL